ncbi:MAG: hypothetical protein R2709_00760 [Marmoricola sp.]
MRSLLTGSEQLHAADHVELLQRSPTDARCVTGDDSGVHHCVDPLSSDPVAITGLRMSMRMKLMALVSVWRAQVDPDHSIDIRRLRELQREPYAKGHRPHHDEYYCCPLPGYLHSPCTALMVLSV